MFNIVYKTTNILTTEYYFGVHSTNRLNDGYLGSGLRIKRSICKYGKNSFTREIVFQTNTKIEAFQKERELLTNQILLDPLCLNLHKGGEGERYNYRSSIEANQKRSKALKGRRSPTKGITLNLSSEERQNRRNRTKRNIGISLTNNHKRNLSFSNTKRMKLICVDGVVVPSLRSVINHYNIHMSTLQARLASKNWNWHYYSNCK